MTRNVLKKLGLIRIAFIAAVGLPLIITTSAHAQAPAASPAAGAAPAGAQAEAERVIVTGSNIPTAEEVGPNPVLSLNRDFINKSAERTTEQLVKDMPVANANAVPVSNNNVSQGGPVGASSIALRAFTPEATLILIDGMRIAPYPGTNFFDINTIPLAAIDTIEILKDGASATYGADAVAGVVNFKLYKDYRGSQVTLYYGDTLDKDAGIYQGDVLFGTGDDKVSIVGDLFFYHHNSLFQRDRGNSDEPPFVSSNSSPWNLQIANQTAAATAGATVVPSTSHLQFAAAPVNTDGFAPASAYTYSHGRSQTWNFNIQADAYGTQERWGGYAAFNDKICDDQVQLYGDFYYDDTKSFNTAASSASGSFNTAGQGTIAIPPHSNLNGVAPPNSPLFVGQPAPGGDPNNPTCTSANSTGCGQYGTNTPTNAFNPFNPFNQILAGGTRARVSDFGPRQFNVDNTDWLATLGVKGDKLFDGTWGYDAGFRYNQITNLLYTRDVSVSRLNRVMNANDSIFQPGSNDFLGTTVPYDPFDSYFGKQVPTNAKVVDYARLLTKDVTTSKLTELSLNIYTTDLFDLPAGGVGVAFGGEWRRESYNFNPDDEHRVPDEIGVAKAPPSDGGRKDYAFYAETIIPIFSPQQGIWGFHSLEFDAAGRFEDFRNNDTNVLVPKVELRWQPFNDEFTIRSTWSEGFLEPALFELYSSSVFTLVTSNNGGHVNNETTYEYSGNKNLQPEDSRAWTGGVVYTPKWVEKVVPGLAMTATIDLYDIERTGVITLPPASDVIARFNAGQLAPGEAVQVDASTGAVSFIKTFFSNAGRQESKGADFSLQFQYQTPNWGTFSWVTEATYLESFKYQATTTTSYQEVVGQSVSNPNIGLEVATGGDGFLKWKGLSRLDWSWRNFDLNWTVHYTDGFHEWVGTGPFNPTLVGRFPVVEEHWVKQTWFFDCQAGYDLIFTPPVESQPVAGYSKGGKEVMTNKDGKAVESAAAYTMPCWKTILNNSTLTIGCNNVFGQDPPVEFGQDYGNSQFYPGYIYDNIGRFVYVELKKKF